MGYTLNVGPECEFFLFHTDDDGQPTTISHEKAGYFDLGPIDLGENARRDMVLTLEDMGFEIEASHHEAAPAQHEIDFKYDEAIATADNIMTFKLAVKTIAKRHGLFASFMPKPKYGINGSGMHINMSLEKDGKNIFFDENDQMQLSKEAYYFIGGIMLSWNFGKLNTLKNDRKLKRVQQESVRIEQESFIFNTKMEMLMQDAEIKKMRNLVKEDEKVLRLRESIRQASEVKYANGVYTISELISDVNYALIAQQEKLLREIELKMMIYSKKITLGL